MISRDYDKLIGAMAGLARASENNPKTENGTRLILEGLMTINSGEQTKAELIEQITEEKYKIVPNCRICQSPCGHNDDYDMNELWDSDEAVIKAKIKLIEDICRNTDDIEHIYTVLSMISYDFDAEYYITIDNRRN